MNQSAASRRKQVSFPADGGAEPPGLRHVDDERPGIARRKSGRGFRYIDPDGKAIRDGATIQRIGSLAIPPAWTDVWICPDPRGHLQATGRDAAGRKQHRYHPGYRAFRDQTKYHRLVAFAEALPKLRRTTARQLRQRGLPRDKVLAAVIALLEKTLIRVGNDEYAKANGHFGLTTLRDRHVKVRGKTARFTFTGKSGVRREVELSDPRLARIIRRCRDLPGQELFQYLDGGGKRRDVTSADVNDHLRAITGEAFSAKDFRTWAGTVLAATHLRAIGPADSESAAKKHVVETVDHVSKRLGNTRSVCRKCYIHPRVIEAYMKGVTIPANGSVKQRRGLSGEESAVVGLLKRKTV